MALDGVGSFAEKIESICESILDHMWLKPVYDAFAHRQWKRRPRDMDRRLVQRFLHWLPARDQVVELPLRQFGHTLAEHKLRCASPLVSASSQRPGRWMTVYPCAVSWRRAAHASQAMCRLLVRLLLRRPLSSGSLEERRRRTSRHVHTTLQSARVWVIPVMWPASLPTELPMRRLSLSENCGRGRLRR
jgi:hypothetical protein